MKIFIQSIPRETATKIHEFKDMKTGKRLNKTKSSSACKDTYQPLYSTRLGGLNTGLLDKVDNPWYVEKNEAEELRLKAEIDKLSVKTEKTDNELKEFNKLTETYELMKLDYARNREAQISKLGKGWEYLADKKEITRQELLEKKHGREPGFYTNRQWRRGDDPKSITFMQTFKVALNDGTTVLDTNNTDHELAYYFLLASKYVANSKREYLEHKYPYATHYISLQEEDEELALKTRKLRNDAVVKLSSDEMTDEYKQMICNILGWAKVNLTPMQLYNLISSKIENANVSKPNNDVAQFMKLAKMIDTPTGRTYLKNGSFLMELVNNRIVSNSRDTYTWVSRGITLGDTFDEAVSFFDDPNKGTHIESLKKELKAKLVA